MNTQTVSTLTPSSITLKVVAARRISHPTIKGLDKHYFLIRASELPEGISNDANAREPNVNKPIYKKVRDSLLGGVEEAPFDLLNKGITILADKIDRLDEVNYLLHISERYGIVDGGHTYKIITENKKNNIPDDQFVEVKVITGLDKRLIDDIARGLNTSVQVKQQSLDDLAQKYDFIKQAIADQPYHSKFGYNEGENKDYDVKTILACMECFNIISYPNGEETAPTKHPTRAYSSIGTVIKDFSKVYDTHLSDLSENQYYKLKNIIPEILSLYDTIRYEFYDALVGESSRRGGLKIMEKVEDSVDMESPFLFPPIRAKYILHDGPSLAVLAAFRTMVIMDPETKMVIWRNRDFNAVVNLWQQTKKNIAASIYNYTQETSNRSEILGKSSDFWDRIYSITEKALLRKQLAEKAA